MEPSFTTLPIIYESEKLVAINKPNKLLTHYTRISEDNIYAADILSEQLGYTVQPVHRLDRATSGVLLFAKDSAAASELGTALQDRKVEKNYIALVRGYVSEDGILDRPLFSETKQKEQDAETHFKRLAISEMPYPISRYPSSRYSLIEVFPKTGRHHQIRKHFAQYRHPIIGDRRHGDVKQNNYWRDELGTDMLFLHAAELNFEFQGESINIKADLPILFKKTLGNLTGF